MAAAHTATIAAIPGFEPIAAGCYSEAFVTMELTAPPHDGERDKQYGMAAAFCATTHRAPSPPKAMLPEARAMLLMPWNLRLVCVHGAWWCWRPHMYPHFLIPPAPYAAALTTRPYDAIWGCQLSARSADVFLKRCPQDTLPQLIAEERTLRAMRHCATAPSLPIDIEHAHSVYDSMGITPF